MLRTIIIVDFTLFQYKKVLFVSWIPFCFELSGDNISATSAYFCLPDIFYSILFILFVLCNLILVSLL